MSIDLLARHTTDYHVNIQVFEGPLDLLLHLIERAEMDITKVSLAQVTDQFLEYIRIPDRINVELISHFVAIAAKLLQIKSEAILPHHLIRSDEEENLGEDLVQQLKLYRKFKQVAETLESYEEKGLHTYLRVAQFPHSKNEVDLSEIYLVDLISALKDVSNRSQIVQPLSMVMRTPRISIRQKINQIANFFKNRKNGTFFEILIKKPTKEDIVVTFLAMLELIKRHVLNAIQEKTFGEIELNVLMDWSETDVIEVEFED